MNGKWMENTQKSVMYGLWAILVLAGAETD